MEFSTRFKLNILFVFCFLLFVSNVNGQIQLSATSNRSIDLDCRDSGPQMDIGISPAKATVTPVGEIQGPNGELFLGFVDDYQLPPSSIFQFNISIFDQDLKVGGFNAQLPGKGPYRVSFVIIQGMATFEDLTTAKQFIVVRDGLDLIVPPQRIISGGGFVEGEQPIQIQAIIEDMEENETGCSSSLSPRDQGIVFQWTINPVSFNFSCPSELVFDDHNFNIEFSVSNQGGFTYDLVPINPTNSDDLYIIEEISEWTPNFELDDVTEDFLIKNRVFTVEDVLDVAVIMQAEFGGFALSYIRDSYSVSKSTLPFKQSAIINNNQLGYCFKQEFKCGSNNILRTHFAKFRVESIGTTDRIVYGEHFTSNTCE